MCVCVCVCVCVRVFKSVRKCLCVSVHVLGGAASGRFLFPGVGRCVCVSEAGH